MLLSIFIQTSYLSFAIATPGTLRIFLYKSFKGMQRFFNFTLNIQTKHLTKTQPPKKIGFLILSQETCTEPTFLRSFSAALISDFIVLSNLLRRFGFFFLTVKSPKADTALTKAKLKFLTTKHFYSFSRYFGSLKSLTFCFWCYPWYRFMVRQRGTLRCGCFSNSLWCQVTCHYRYHCRLRLRHHVWSFIFSTIFKCRS